MTNFDHGSAKPVIDRDDIRNSVTKARLPGIVFLGEIGRIAAAKIRAAISCNELSMACSQPSAACDVKSGEPMVAR